MGRGWNVPGPAGQEFGLSDFVGELLFCLVGGYEPTMSTQYGEKAAVRATVIVLSGPKAGEIYRDVLIFNTRVVQRLRGAVGEAILGFVTQLASGRGNPAVDIEDPGQAGYDVATRYVDAYPGRLAELLAEVAESHRVQQQKQQPQQRPPQQASTWRQQEVQQPSQPPPWGGAGQPEQRPSWNQPMPPAPNTPAAEQGRPQQGWSPSSVLGEPGGTREEAGF